MMGSQVDSTSNSAATTVASALAPKKNSQVTAKTASASGSSSSSDSTTSSATDGATITASDFLTLLVTELKNQDPTQPTDPNAYIQQLVGVNSLQQLISINQDLTPTSTTTPTTGS